jgi:hypothetical protein
VFDSEITIPNDDDILQLEKWRKEFAAADLELPEGYNGDGVATAIAVGRDGKLLGSLTASIVYAVSLDPLIRNPNASHTETLAGLFALTRALEYQAKLNGVAASFIAVPDSLPEYQKLVQKCGFSPTAESCKIYRHSFKR